MVVWALEVQQGSGSSAGQVKTFAEWGLTQPVIRYASQDADVASFKYAGQWEDADHLFKYGDRIRILKDGALWFVGTIVRLPQAISAQSEEQLFEVRGPWFYLEEHEYQVPWTSWHAQNPESIWNTHVHYNIANGALITTRQSMMLVLDYLLGLYPDGEKPFQYNAANILPGVELYVPVHEDRDLTCAQVLQQQLRWHRDVTVQFDYSVSPPNLQIRRRNQSEVKTLAVPNAQANGPMAEWEFNPRPELQRPCVVIRYERRNVIDGTPYFALDVDAYPPQSTGREFGAWTMSVDLLGFNKTMVRGTLRCRVKNYQFTAWWQNHEPKLTNPQAGGLGGINITDIKILTPLQLITGSAPLVEVGDPVWYPNPIPLENELVEGSIAPWMKLANGQPIAWRHETITAKAKYKYFSDPVSGFPLYDFSSQGMDVSASLIATNAPAGESHYEATESIEFGDPQPIGLAQYLYEQVKDLEWAGRIVLSEQEVGGLVRIGNTINVTGGRPEWAIMNALVQSVVEDIENGRTEIVLGPPEHLGVQDLIELLKVGRRRQRWSNPDVADDGELQDDITLGSPTAKADSGLGPGQLSYMSITPDKDVDPVHGRYSHINLDGAGAAVHIERRDKPGKFQLSLGTGPQGAPANQKPQLVFTGDADGGQVNVGLVRIDLADIVDAVPVGDARTIKLREVCVKVGGVEGKMLVLAGGPY
jgi:hypothetical protein